MTLIAGDDQNQPSPATLTHCQDHDRQLDDPQDKVPHVALNQRIVKDLAGKERDQVDPRDGRSMPATSGHCLL